ncbi:MAG: ABC transporter substrate-binding protein [Erysipelothrix sp.]|nr:ABC transporter substrate-binding protein [Erysipelothrix sp.]
MKKILIICLLFVLTACSSSNSKKNKVTIGIIRVPNDTVLAIQNKWIEEAFEPLGLEVEFRFFDSGVSMNQAFASGSLDIAEMGFTNAVVALHKKLPVELFWIHDVIGESEALVVNDESITDISQLKGKKIATIFNSTSHLSLLKALELNGLSSNDVTLLNMQTAEIVAAWNRGDLDAAYTWEPTLSSIKESGKVLIDSSELAKDGLMTTNVGLVHKDFAENHEDALKEFIKALDKAYQLRERSFDTVVSDTEDYLGITKEQAEIQLKGSKWISKEEMISDTFMGKDYLDVFYETSVFWESNGFIDSELDMKDIEAFINTDYIEAVINDD